MVTTLTGEVAAISGGLGDIGLAIAVELARRGADIAVCDVRDDAEADPLLEQVGALRRRARYDRADVSAAAAVGNWMDAVEQDLGLPTLIIPNAAVVNLVKFEQLTPAQWDDELAINLNGMFHVAQLATQRLRAADKPGRVVFIGSWAGHVVHPRLPTYCVAKAAVRMLCRCMAAELSPHGILVNEVAPGWVDGGLTGKLLEQDPDSRPEMVQATPVRCLITPAEVALQVAHLCEPSNRQMTGSTLLMDGGLSLFGTGGQKE
jgi:glucose 1-dehydrogenase